MLFVFGVGRVFRFELNYICVKSNYILFHSNLFNSFFGLNLKTTAFVCFAFSPYFFKFAFSKLSSDFIAVLCLVFIYVYNKQNQSAFRNQTQLFS